MTEHRVSLFFDFTCDGTEAADRLALLPLSQAADPDWVHPSRLAAEAARPIAQATLWDWTAWTLSPDFHPYVRSVLNSSASASSEQTLCLLRSPSAKALFEGRYRAAPGPGARKSGLVLALGAGHRLREMPGSGPVLIDGGPAGLAIEVEIESITAHVFRTGVGLVIPRIRLLPRERDAHIPPELLVEIIPRLGDERRQAAFGWLDDWTVKDSPRFALSTLLRRVIEPAGCRLTRRERIYSYVTVIVDEAVTAERDLAYRLSRHYGASYRPSKEYLGTIFVHPFETVLHAASREGGCTLVCAGSEPRLEFLDNWLEQADPYAYFPLQVAAVHEYVALLDMAQGAGLPIDPGAHDRQTIAALKALSHRFLLFRLRYRLLQVSTITAHEFAFAATVEALGIEVLSTKIARDLVEVERRLVELASERAFALQSLAAERERRRERKTAGLTGLASGALAYITMASLGDHMSDFLHHWDLASDSTRFALELAFQILGAGLAGWSFYYAVWWKHGSHHEAEHVLEHERTEATLARREEETPDQRAGVEAPHHS